MTSEFPFTNRCRASFMDRRFRIALSLTITQQNEGPKPQGLKPKTLTLQCQLSFICDGCFVSGQLLQIQLYFSRQMFHLLKIKSNCTQGTQNWTQGTQNCTQVDWYTVEVFKRNLASSIPTWLSLYIINVLFVDSLFCTWKLSQQRRIS